MSVFRSALLITITSALTVAAFGACAGAEPPRETDPRAADEPNARVPDPLPRYARADLDSGVTLPPETSEPELQIHCSGNQPYVCTLDDGTFRCSEHPCVPGCDRVGCLGGEVCVSCAGAYRCVAPGDASGDGC